MLYHWWDPLKPKTYYYATNRRLLHQTDRRKLKFCTGSDKYLPTELGIILFSKKVGLVSVLLKNKQGEKRN